MVALSLPQETDGKFGSITSGGATLFREVIAPPRNREGLIKAGSKSAVLHLIADGGWPINQSKSKIKRVMRKTEKL